jgi:hypothetical protein
MCLEQELGGEFALESRFEGSSIGELVEFASRHPTVPRAKKPKRPWTDWFSWRLPRHFNLKKPNQPPPAVDPNVQQKMPRFTQDQLKQVVVFGENDPDTEREIANLERKLGVRFPETYRHILALGGEAHMGPVPTAAAPELHFDFLPAERERFEFVSMKVATAHKRVLKSKSDMRAIIPFGALGNGDYVCFDYRGAPEPAIVLWNHEKAFSSPDPLLRIADSFDDFVASALKQRTSRQSPPR